MRGLVRRLPALILFALVAASCGETPDVRTSDTSGTTAAQTVVAPITQAPTPTAKTEPTISFDDDTCSSSDPRNWPVEPLEIQVANNTGNRAAVVMGTYADGSTYDDLVAYGSDISTRPDFINSLEILEVDPESADSLLFDYGPGTYFMVCMPDTNTMVVLDDLTIP